MYVTFAGVVAIICTILAVAAEGRRSAKYVFTAFEPNSGWTPGWSWVVGVLHAAYATSATGMVISMSEEVKSPSTQVPKAMLGATVMNFVIGFVFLVPLTFVLPDINAFLNDPYAQPVPVILRSAVGSEAGAFVLSVPIMLLGIFCGTACTTATSRCVWAFARDNAMPASQWLKKVNRGLGVPLNGMIASFVVQVLLALIWFGSHAAFNAFNGVGVIFLNLSYVMPIGISLFRGRKDLVGSPFNLGTVGGIIANVISCGKSRNSQALPRNQSLTLTPFSLDLPRHPPLLHAGRHPGDSREHELRLRRLRGRRRLLRPLVRHPRPQDLRGPASPRRCRDQEGQRRLQTVER
jgi:amino acid transporter